MFFCSHRFPLRRGQQRQYALCCKTKYLSSISGAAVVTVGNCSQTVWGAVPAVAFPFTSYQDNVKA